MRILIIRNTPDVMEYSAGNYNLQEIGLARTLNRNGHPCDVVYSGGRTEKTVEIEYAPGRCFHLYYLKTLNIFRNGYQFGVNKLVENYDILHSGEYDQLRSWLLARKYPEKLVIFQGPYESSYAKRYHLKCLVIDRLFLPCYRKKKVKFMTKSRLAEEFLRKKGLQDVTTVGVGFDLEQMTREDETVLPFSQKLREKKKAGERLLLYIGELTERKNAKFLLEVLKGCLTQNEAKKISLVIIGKGDSEYAGNLWKYARENGLEEHIIYEQRVTQKHMPDIYQLADVFLLPTRFEIFGMVLLEAMYYACPVITTYNGGSSVLIAHEQDGYVEELDIDRWKERIMLLLQNDSVARQVGHKAHEKIAEEFTWDALADKFISCYQERFGKR